MNLRKAEYKCNCSKEYLSGVLVSLGKDQLKDILREDGEIKVHCHYCNKDYRFTEEDVEKMFP
ncbi:MAG: Hsp33 family molecular chaperone HslO [Christensenellaceae bacterium]